MSLFPARMKKIQTKMKALECSQHFFYCKSIGNMSDVQGQLTVQCMVRSGSILNSFQTLWLSLLPARMKKIRSKMKALECSLTSCINFSDAQGQITPESMVVSGQNLNSSKLSCMTLLPARMKMIQSKMMELEWSQHFSHYKPLGFFSDAQGQLFLQSLFLSGRISNLFEMLWC